MVNEKTSIFIQALLVPVLIAFLAIGFVLELVFAISISVIAMGLLIVLKAQSIFKKKKILYLRR